ncbi:DUF6468 domain-containing protein [uncultured Roseovarius sp.]|uniref:DUF6468 domain-containing protein n=1 Tax=uncultured Roseovarius sp. TaxID=293344 RepID=UPI002620DCE5|nr:DUF6468 domain-containing protein [uncultured Roseovarius sp.]
MEMIADVLLVAGAVGAGFYCYILARRLTRFNDLESGMGGAVAVLSAQVDDLTKTLHDARHTADESTRSLEALTVRAEDVARRLELLVASMHDLSDPPPKTEPKRTEPPEDRSAVGSAQASGPVFKRHPGMAREVST